MKKNLKELLDAGVGQLFEDVKNLENEVVGLQYALEAEQEERAATDKANVETYRELETERLAHEHAAHELEIVHSKLLGSETMRKTRLRELDAVQGAIAILIPELVHWRDSSTKQTKKELLGAIISRLDNAYFGVVDYDIDDPKHDEYAKPGFPGWYTENKLTGQ